MYLTDGQWLYGSRLKATGELEEWRSVRECTGCRTLIAAGGHLYAQGPSFVRLAHQPEDASILGWLELGAAPAQLVGSQDGYVYAASFPNTWSAPADTDGWLGSWSPAAPLQSGDSLGDIYCVAGGILMGNGYLYCLITYDLAYGGTRYVVGAPVLANGKVGDWDTADFAYAPEHRWLPVAACDGYSYMFGDDGGAWVGAPPYPLLWTAVSPPPSRPALATCDGNRLYAFGDAKPDAAPGAHTAYFSWIE
jgi:hypothetical protein